ncbi:MAG: M14 family metallopeptidase [Planctomycetota bacterium]
MSCATGASASAQAVPATARARQGIPFGDSRASQALEPFFPGTSYDPEVPHPDTLLRQPLGTFTAHHHEILAALRAMAEKSPRMRIVPFGHTHEGRELAYVVIGSTENVRDLDRVRGDLARLADPRGLGEADAQRILKSSPAVAWLGYSIHGDETSGSDASLAVAHHFAAGTSADVTDILKQVVIVIDPCQNPDGRERILSQFEQGAGYVPNLDTDTMGRGRWPYGRGNHYLFDMNRDWMWGTQPETRARWAAILSWHPQLLVDAHEMGALDSYLFYPASAPFTPRYPEATIRWWQKFGNDQAAAFDKRGWSYYTREWADSWYPGYTDSWASFVGAIGILYEQARFGGAAVRRASGEVATYREAVHHQAVSCLANVATLAANREEILRDYLAAKRANVAAETPGNDRMFVFVPGRSPSREEHFTEMLAGQGIEIFRAEEGFTGKRIDAAMAGDGDERAFPAGSVLIPARQPLSTMVQAWLEFDPRYTTDSLNRERKELERKQRSKAYDVTAWSPAHSFDLDAAWCDAVEVKKTKITSLPPREKGVVGLASPSESVYGWIVDGEDDGAVVFAAHGMEKGLQIQMSDEPFTSAGRGFSRGSLLVRRHENGADVASRVAQAAESAGVRVHATGTARSPDEKPDLGGQHFHLLSRPRVGLLGNAPFDTDSFGHIWHVLDTQIGIPVTQVDAQQFGGYDLRRYNVLILPDGGDVGSILKENAEALRNWVRGGGTLVACGGSATRAVVDAEMKLSSVKMRPDVLDELEKYALSVKREREAGTKPVDEAALWGDKPAEKPTEEAGKDAKEEKEEGKEEDEKGDEKGKEAKDGATKEKEDLKRRDRWLRTFSPRGVILRGEVNPDAWITAGCGGELPVFFEGGNVYLSELPVRTAVRLAASDRVRISGLVWPEARERIADSAYCTVEGQGAGQVILFASPPAFRGWFPGTARLLANAVVYGPGAGARQPLGW